MNQGVAQRSSLCDQMARAGPGSAPRRERADHREVRPDPAGRGPRPVAELLAQAADRAVRGDRARDVDDEAAGLAHVERQQVVHRGGRRHRPVDDSPDGEERPGHRGQQPGPALHLAHPALVAPVQPLLGRGRGRALVAPLEATGRAPDARVAQRLGERRQAARARTASRHRSGRRRRRGRPRRARPGSRSGRRAAAPAAGPADRWAASRRDDRLGRVGRAVRTRRGPRRSGRRCSPGRGRPRSARRCGPPRRGRRSRRQASGRRSCAA